MKTLRFPDRARRFRWPHALPLLAGALALSGSPAPAQEFHSNDLTPAGAIAGRLSGTSGGRHSGTAQVPVTGYPHAVLLSGNALTSVDLNPATRYYSASTTLRDELNRGRGR